jgi:hypothetical protein
VCVCEIARKGNPRPGEGTCTGGRKQNKKNSDMGKVTWEKCIMLSSDISARRNIHITHSRRTVKVTALDKGIYLLSISTNIHHSMIEFSEFSPKIEPTRESMYINKYL